MRKLNLILAILAIGLLVFNCSSDEKDQNLDSENGVIPTKSFSLSDTIDYGEQRWNEVEKDGYLYVIKDADELRMFMYLDEDSIPYTPNVNFSKENVLVALGTSNSGISKTEHKYRKTAKGEYTLEVDLWLNAATVMQRWVVAIIVPKPEDGDEVKLIVNKKY